MLLITFTGQSIHESVTPTNRKIKTGRVFSHSAGEEVRIDQASERKIEELGDVVRIRMDLVFEHDISLFQTLSLSLSLYLSLLSITVTLSLSPSLSLFLSSPFHLDIGDVVSITMDIVFTPTRDSNRGGERYHERECYLF